MGAGIEKQKAPALVAMAIKVIEEEILKRLTPAKAMGPMKKGPGPIVDSGANCSVGQTPHRSNDMPINIDPNEGA